MIFLKFFFQIVDKLLEHGKSSSLPEHDSPDSTCTYFQ